MAVLSTLQSTVEKPAYREESDSESSNEPYDEDFEVKVDEYEIPLQLVYHTLVRNSELADADMRYYLLDSVRILAIQCEVLMSVAKSHKRFIMWCQESLLTGILWQLLESSHSQVTHKDLFFRFLLRYRYCDRTMHFRIWKIPSASCRSDKIRH